MIDERFIFLGLLFNVFGTAKYIIATLRGQTKPNRVTFFLWALAPLIAFAAQIHEGVGLSSLMTFIVGFNPLLIFLASFVNKRSVWKLHTLDKVCGALSLVGLGLWLIFQTGEIAILFAIAADALAAIPTVVKSYHEPETENPWPFIAGIVSATVALLTAKVYDFATISFPVYILLICIILVYLIALRRRSTNNTPQ